MNPLQPQYYPTVLVARDDDGLDGPLVDCLQRNGFHVLEAHDWAHVFDVVRVHSRPIHLLLADVSMDAHVPILKEHRSELQVVFVKKPVDADVVLAKVRQLLGSPPPRLQFGRPSNMRLAGIAALPLAITTRTATTPTSRSQSSRQHHAQWLLLSTNALGAPRTGSDAPRAASGTPGAPQHGRRPGVAAILGGHSCFRCAWQRRQTISGWFAGAGGLCAGRAASSACEEVLRNRAQRVNHTGNRKRFAV